MCVFGWCWDSPPCPPLLVRRPLKGVNWRRIFQAKSVVLRFRTTFGKLSLSLWSHTYKPNSKELQNETPWPLFRKKTSVPTSSNRHRETRLQNILCKCQRQSMDPEVKSMKSFANTFTIKGNRDIQRLFELFGGQESPTNTCLSSHLQQTFAVSERQRANSDGQQQDKNQSHKAVACQLFEAISTLKHRSTMRFPQHIFLLQPHNRSSPHRPRYTNELHGHHRSSQYLRIQYSEYVSNHLGRHFKPSIVGLGFENNSALIYRWQGFPVVKLLMLALHMRHWSPEMMNSAVIRSVKCVFFVDPIQTYQYIISLIVIYIVYQHLYI